MHRQVYPNCRHTRMHIYTNMHAYTHTHARTYARTHAHTHTHTHVHIKHTHTRACAHTHTHTHTHTYIINRSSGYPTGGYAVTGQATATQTRPPFTQAQPLTDKHKPPVSPTPGSLHRHPTYLSISGCCTT